MRKLHLTLMISSSLFCGFIFGQKTARSPQAFVAMESSKRVSEITKCREEVEVLKSQCSVDSASAEPSNINNPESSTNSSQPSSESVTTVKSKSRSVDIAFESDVKDFLKSSEVPNFFDELKTAKIVGEEQLKVLNGRFLGQVAFDDSEKQNWDLEMNINGQVYDGEAKGDKIVSLSKNGKIFARTTGRGRIKGVLTMNSDPSAILIEVNGDEGFIQLYFMPRLDIFSGIYYRKVAMGQFEREGTVKLSRL